MFSPRSAPKIPLAGSLAGPQDRVEGIGYSVRKALIFEEHDACRKALAFRLGHEGFEGVFAAGPPKEVREFASGDIALAVVGLDYTDGRGVEIVRRLQELRPDLPVLALTVDPEAARGVLGPGAPRGQFRAADPLLPNLADLVRDLARDREGAGPSSKEGPVEEAAHHPDNTPLVEPGGGQPDALPSLPIT